LIDLKIIEEFSEAVFVGVDVESLLVEEEVLLFQTTVPVRKAVTFDPTVGSPFKIIEEFQDVVFLGLDVESLLGEAEVSSLQTRRPF
jgi:hypothetical protein